MPVRSKPSAGNWFHCLQATSQALQPMHSVVSVKNPVAMRLLLFARERRVFQHLRALAVDTSDYAALLQRRLRNALGAWCARAFASLAHIAGKRLAFVNL